MRAPHPPWRVLVALSLVALGVALPGGSQELGGTSLGPFRRLSFELPGVPQVYVASFGVDHPASGFDPFNPVRTIGFGVVQAVASGIGQVSVAAGVYDEGVPLQLVSGIDVLGGFSWSFGKRDPVQFLTLLNPHGSANPAVLAQDIVGVPTVLSGFHLFGPVATGVGVSSEALRVVDCDDALRIEQNVVHAGNGGRGADGAAGSAGSDGSYGGDGADALDTLVAGCLPAGGDLPGGVGGSGGCRGVATDGGGGGSATYPLTYDQAGVLGDGQAGANGGGLGGVAGRSWVVYTSSCVPLIPQIPTYGFPGDDGPAGDPGSGGSGAVDPLGTVVGGAWLGAAGNGGTAGTPGGGGGGGGACAGLLSSSACQAALGVTDVLGPTGGGGGAGGCGGDGGGAGSAGGASVGIALHFSSDPGPAVPVLVDNLVRMGRGGDGGSGGAGGDGGQGGRGGRGGRDSILGLPAAGSGGIGGRGGGGGGGGGGAGGASFAILLSGPASIPSSYTALNTIDGSHAAGGAGGTGGRSASGPGSQGVDGAVVSVVLLP